MSTTNSPSEFYKMNKQIDEMIERADNISNRLDKLSSVLTTTVDSIISAADEATRLSFATLQILKTLKVDTDGTIRFELLEQQIASAENSKPATDTSNTSEETNE